MKFVSAVLLLVVYLLGTPASAAGGPGPTQPWIGYPDIYYPYGGVILPQNVTGGSKGVGTINAQGIYVNGQPVPAGVVQPSQGGTGLTAFTRTGNTTIFGTSAGTLTNGDCVSVDSHGNFVDAGGPCTTGGGGGTVSHGTANELTYYGASGTTVSGLSTANNAVLVTNGSGVPSESTTLPNGLALGTPASLTLTNATGTPSAINLLNGTNLPITGISGLGGGVANALGTTVTGSGGITLATAPTLTGSTLAGATVTGSFTATGLVTNADLVHASTTVNGAPCTLGSTCTITATAASATVGTTTIVSGTSGDIEYNNAGVLGEKGVTGTGNVVLASAPTLAGAAVTGSFTATGLVTNADLANSSTTVNGQVCALGGACAITATSNSVTVGVTYVNGGSANNIEFNNSGVLGEKTTSGFGSVVLATSPSISGVTITGSLTATGLVTNADLANSSTTINGQTCTLGSTCTTAAAAGTLTGSTLASGVTASSLTSVGTLAGLTTGAVEVTQASYPQIDYCASGNPTNEKCVVSYEDTVGTIHFSMQADDRSSTNDYLAITRSGTSPTLATFYTPITVNGTALASTVDSANPYQLNGQTKKISDLRSFGAKCDGTTVDTTAINNWLASAANGATLVAPSGTCLFDNTLQLSTSGSTITGLTVVGQGYYTTVFKYVGSATNIDLMDVGTAGDGNYTAELTMTGFRLTSATAMTGGYALHLWHVVRAVVDPVIDGQDGSGNFYNGVWYDENDVLSVPWNDVRATHVLVTLNGSKPGESWWSNFVDEIHFGKGKIANGIGAVTSIGMLIGGGVGGMTCDSIDIIGNQYNLVVDNSITGTNNQTQDFGSCFFDTPENGGASVLLNDSVPPSGGAHDWSGDTKRINLSVWTVGVTGLNAIVVQNYRNGIVVAPGTIAGGPYGILDEDASAIIDVPSTAQLYNNTTAAIGSTVSNPKISINNPLFYQNGTDIDANSLTSTLPIYYTGGSCSAGLAVGGSTSGISYSTQRCGWTLDGYNAVVDYVFVLSSKGSNSGGVTIAGLPVPQSTLLVGGGGPPNYATNWTGLSGMMTANVDSLGGTFANLYQSNSTGLSTVTDANLTNSTTLDGRLFYHR